MDDGQFIRIPTSLFTQYDCDRITKALRAELAWVGQFAPQCEVRRDQSDICFSTIIPWHTWKHSADKTPLIRLVMQRVEWALRQYIADESS